MQPAALHRGVGRLCGDPAEPRTVEWYRRERGVFGAASAAVGLCTLNQVDP
jgi:hypothetical protein